MIAFGRSAPFWVQRASGALLREQVAGHLLPSLANLGIWPVGDDEPQRDRKKPPTADGCVNPRLVAPDREMAVSGERDHLVGADGVRAVTAWRTISSAVQGAGPPCGSARSAATWTAVITTLRKKSSS